MKSFCSFHLYEGSRNLTQVTKLTWQAHFLSVSSCPVPVVLMLDYISYRFSSVFCFSLNSLVVERPVPKKYFMGLLMCTYVFMF